MIVVGVDPGSRVTGFGVISVEGNRHRCLDYGTVKAGSTPSASLPVRLLEIHQRLIKVLEQYQPNAVAVEDIFHASNARSALKLGQARGVILLAAAQSGVECFEYTPLQVKKAVCGFGRAEKDQVQFMVRKLLGLAQVPEPFDASDALAVALCHAFIGSGVLRTQPRSSSHR